MAEEIVYVVAPGVTININDDKVFKAGDIITPETLAQYSTPEQLGAFLKQETYKMKKWQQ